MLADGLGMLVESNRGIPSLSGAASPETRRVMAILREVLN